MVDDARPLNGPVELGPLFDRCHRRLYTLARRMSHDSEDSRDLVQETFLRAARRVASVPRADGEAEAWLVRVLINLCKDRQRRLVVRQRYARDVAPKAATEDPEAPSVARATVRAALATLPPKRRACIVLRELEGLSVQEVSQVLGLQAVTVRWHLSAARRQLARWRDRHATLKLRDGGKRNAG